MTESRVQPVYAPTPKKSAKHRDGYIMANVDPSLHDHCLSTAPGEVIGTGAPHGWPFASGDGTVGA
mgnify:CR=1 FL=1